MSDKQNLFLLKIISVSSLVLSVLSLGLSIASVVEVKTHKCEPVEIVTETTTVPETTTIPETTTVEPETTTKKVEPTTVKTEPTTHKTVQPRPMNIIDDEVELLAWVMIAEAEGTSEYCQRLVIDTILNRVDSDDFPNTITGVVYEKGQFDVMTNGRLYRCEVTDDARRLVREELACRLNSEVLYFRDSYYHSFGTPVTNTSNMYFSK